LNVANLSAFTNLDVKSFSVTNFAIDEAGFMSCLSRINLVVDEGAGKTKSMSVIWKKFNTTDSKVLFVGTVMNDVGLIECAVYTNLKPSVAPHCFAVFADVWLLDSWLLLEDVGSLRGGNTTPLRRPM
jgi:hypothetical protein